MTEVVTKQPGETLLYTFDFVDKIGDTTVALSTISTLTMTAAGLVSGSVAVTKSGQIIDGQGVNVLFAAGTNGEDYLLLCVATGNNGETYELDGILRVLDLAASALVLEDGTIVAGANSYASVAQADTYLRAQARAATWDTLDAATKVGRLIQASAYLDAHCRWRWVIVDTDQTLGWPRSGAIDRNSRTLGSDSIPTAVRDATIEVAMLGAITTERTRAAVSKTVGPISEAYADGSDVAQGVARYGYALAMVSDLVLGSPSNSLRVVRA